ncbi:MAG: SDR family NAD(P)-dependent oxidoreductase [Betaproteobacteria bacterium]|uniref:SDR family NAD(P)-dependent oxidoreductase n=1 Tax=Ferrovum sp. PN-J185 TaxID=1356306 RepID=UPI00079214E7|nr:SDR family NAD(P)-dependent oxidoreductase [Ferrovum sp. PN-J185]KXW55145.1 putative oxidoreductase [Ferrovum sp. PN-J185]MDE2056768.1 SDR family NAD(P)-dependent oxidoreductase [Betaproteobacteria bacterium]
MFFSSNPPIHSWKNKVIWIIGASSGIGAALASILAKKGAHLVLSARSLDKLNEVARTCDSFSTSHTTILPCDILSEEEINATYQRVKLYHQKIDLVIIASGTYDALSIKEFNPQQLPAVINTIETNLTGYYRVISHIIPDFIKNGAGGLAMISSVAGYSGLPRALAYAPTKAALNNLAEGLYAELHPHHIGIYIICPGFVATPMTANNHFPMPALMEVDEAAQAIILGLEKGQFEIHFPKRFTLFLQFLRRLPRSWYIKIISYFFHKNSIL